MDGAASAGVGGKGPWKTLRVSHRLSHNPLEKPGLRLERLPAFPTAAWKTRRGIPTKLRRVSHSAHSPGFYRTNTESKGPEWSLNTARTRTLHGHELLARPKGTDKVWQSGLTRFHAPAAPLFPDHKIPPPPPAAAQVHQGQTCPHPGKTLPHRARRLPREAWGLPHAVPTLPHQVRRSPHRGLTSPHRERPLPHRVGTLPDWDRPFPYAAQPFPYLDCRLPHSDHPFPHSESGSQHPGQPLSALWKGVPTPRIGGAAPSDRTLPRSDRALPRPDWTLPHSDWTFPRLKCTLPHQCRAFPQGKLTFLLHGRVVEPLRDCLFPSRAIGFDTCGRTYAPHVRGHHTGLGVAALIMNTRGGA